PFKLRLDQKPVAGQQQRELMNAYHSSLVQWGRVVSSRVKPVGDRDGELFIGRDNQVGYIVRRTDGETNVMLYHDKNHMEARRPHLQEAIVLISENATQLVASNNWACVVTFLNQSADETRAMRDIIRFVSKGNTATLSIGDKQHNISFSQDR
ncbi:MAG: hypothetical protein AB8B91_19345, partial [Rubripirellula sp.]